MAPLSKQLTTVILDHKYYGSHLNSSCVTTNTTLERKNFQHAGKRLAGLFGDMKLDGHDTVAQYVNPPNEIQEPEFKELNKNVPVTEEWICDHVQVSKYCLQIVCCDNDSCCPNRPAHVKLLLRPLMPNGFLPPPVKYCQRFSGDSVPLQLLKQSIHNKQVQFASLQTRALYPCSARTAFDSFCPSMQKVLPNSTCDQCFRAFPSKAQMLVHRRALHKFVRHQKIDVNKLLKLEYDQRLKNVAFIADHNLSSKEYKAVFKNGDADWITILEYNNEKVLAYMKKAKLPIERFQATGEWMQPQWEDL